MVGLRSRSSHIQTSQQTQRHTTLVLCSVVIVFLLCQLPQAVLKVYSSSNISMTTARQLQVTIVANYCNLLVIINSSINFVLYSVFSSKFRQTFRRFVTNSRLRLDRRSHVLNVSSPNSPTVTSPISKTDLMFDRWPLRSSTAQQAGRWLRLTDWPPSWQSNNDIMCL